MQLHRKKRVALAYLAVSLGLLLAAPLAQAAGPPQIGAAWTTEVNANGASLHAEISPNGSVTTYHFSYIAEAAYQENLAALREGFAGAAKAPAGSDPSISTNLSVHQQLGGLQPETAYRYRVFARSSEGTETYPDPPRTFTTEGLGGAALLADDRGWEMVSPIEKDGGAIQGFGQNFGGDVLQAAANGDSVTYSSTSSFGEGAQSAPASQYLARRAPAGWASENISIPSLSGSYGDEPVGVPYQLFSPDLARGLVLNGERCRAEGHACPVANPPLPGTEAPAGYQNYYLRNDEDGAFTALLTGADLPELALGPEQFELAFAGASPDLRHIVLATCAALTPEATEVPSGGGGCEAEEPNLYEWEGGELHLVNLLPGEAHGTPGAHLASQSAAISANGSRIYFTAGGDLYLREGAQTRQVDESVGGGGSFQTASADGSLAFFTTATGQLERYDAQTKTSEPLATGVEGVLGASEDGSYIYYATPSGLFLRHAGTTTEVATEAAASDYLRHAGTSRVSADGTHLAFLSAASLTGYDNTDQRTGEPDTEVYLYDASGAGSLTCASCNPTGERPLGPSTIPGAIANGRGPDVADSYRPRDLSVGASRLFFDSQDSLVLQDTDNAPDVYEWEAQGTGTCEKPAGCLSLISSGRSAEGASFVDASASGSDAFFLTDGSLVSTDPASADLYDAREGGGFPQLSTPIECEGDACQSLPSEPEDPTPGTLVSGPGNPPVHIPKAPKSPVCKTGFLHRHGKCVKKHHKK